MGWLIAVVVVVASAALVWWSSGRWKPEDARRRHFETEIGKAQGRIGMSGSGSPIDGGPSGF
jgi:hypothetical protein